MSRPAKVAILGVRGFNQQTEQHEVRCFPWDKLHRKQNLKDYDIVIISLLGSENGKRIKPDVFTEVWNYRTAWGVLHNRGQVIVIGDPRFDLTIRDDDGTPVTQPFLTWTGVIFNWLDEFGDTVIPKGLLPDGYKKYVQHAKTWTYCLADCELNPEYWNTKGVQDSRDLSSRPIAHVEALWQNRYDHALAFSYWPQIEVTEKLHPGVRTRTETFPGFGELVLLPPTDLPEYETVALVLRDILRIETDIPEPEWVADIVAPGQAPLDAALSVIREKFQALISEYDAKQDERELAREPLRLLYDESHSLENAIRGVLRSLGAEVEDPPEDDPNHEDGWITVRYGVDTFEGVLEIKGTRRRQHLESGLKQLHDWQHRGRVLREKNYKPIFIGNSSRDVPLGEREWPFSANWMKAAALQGACAIRAEDLYAIYETDQNGQLDREAFWRAFFTTEGVFHAQPFIGSVDSMDGPADSE